MSDVITEKQAADIYQDLLDRIGASYFDNDYVSFRTAMAVPHTYSSDAKEQMIDSYEQLEVAFHSFREYLQGMGVTEMHRECTGATALGNRKIIGGHTTALRRDGLDVQEPYGVWATLELTDEGWKVISSVNDVSDTAWQSKAFGEGVHGLYLRPSGTAESA